MRNAGEKPPLRSNPNPATASNLKHEIKSRVKGKTAIVGIGNPIRGDDGFGPKLIEMLKGRSIDAFLFDCGTAPENYILPIVSTSSDTIILIDTANLGVKPGEMKVLDSGDISNVSFSTHSPSPRLFVDLLRTGQDNLNIFIVSIQPKMTSLGEGLSVEVKNSLSILADIFVEALS